MNPPNEKWFELVEEQIAKLQTDFGLLQDELKKNTETTARVEKNTAGVVTAFQAAEGAFRVLETMGKMAKPLLWIGGLLTSCALWWNSIKTWAAALFK